jgi:hypothetical protein
MLGNFSMSLMSGLLPDLSGGPKKSVLFHRKGVVLTMYVSAFRFAWKSD